MYELCQSSEGWVVHFGDRRWGPFPTLKRAGEVWRALRTWGHGPWFVVLPA